MLTVELVHSPGVDENKKDEDIYGTLVREPEAQRKIADLPRVKLLNEQNPEHVRHKSPSGQQDADQAQIRAPIGPVIRRFANFFCSQFFVSWQFVRDTTLLSR